MYDLTHRYHARDGVTTMNARKKLFSRNLELYLPFAALLIGMLLMFTSKPIVIQATTPVPMPQVIAGEYSYDKNNWYPLETATELSALDGDLYLYPKEKGNMRDLATINQLLVLAKLS